MWLCHELMNCIASNYFYAKTPPASQMFEKLLWLNLVPWLFVSPPSISASIPIISVILRLWCSCSREILLGAINSTRSNHPGENLFVFDNLNNPSQLFPDTRPLLSMNNHFRWTNRLDVSNLRILQCLKPLRSERRQVASWCGERSRYRHHSIVVPYKMLISSIKGGSWTSNLWTLFKLQFQSLELLVNLPVRFSTPYHHRQHLLQTTALNIFSHASSDSAEKLGSMAQHRFVDTLRVSLICVDVLIRFAGFEWDRAEPARPRELINPTRRQTTSIREFSSWPFNVLRPGQFLTANDVPAYERCRCTLSKHYQIPTDQDIRDLKWSFYSISPRTRVILNQIDVAMVPTSTSISLFTAEPTNSPRQEPCAWKENSTQSLSNQRDTENFPDLESCCPEESSLKTLFSVSLVMEEIVASGVLPPGWKCNLRKASQRPQPHISSTSPVTPFSVNIKARNIKARVPASSSVASAVSDGNSPIDQQYPSSVSWTGNGVKVKWTFVFQVAKNNRLDTLPEATGLLRMRRERCGKRETVSPFGSNIDWFIRRSWELQHKRLIINNCQEELKEKSSTNKHGTCSRSRYFTGSNSYSSLPIDLHVQHRTRIRSCKPWSQ